MFCVCSSLLSDFCCLLFNLSAKINMVSEQVPSIKPNSLKVDLVLLLLQD